MIVMGIRASAQEVRYAILDKKADKSIEFINRTSENRLKYPANMDSIEEKLYWVESEIDRILRQNDAINKIIIKTNEYTGTESSAKRETTYVDAIIMLSAYEHGLSVVRRLNSQIGSTAAKAKEYAENRVGKTDHYWNNTIADAILAAYWEIK